MPEFRPVLFVVGVLLCGLAASMTLPAAADALQGNPDWQVFVLSALPTGFAGMLLALTNRGRGGFTIGLRQGFLLTALSWSALAAFAALPFANLNDKLTYTDAFFEAISGLTTTGSTVLVGLDRLPPGILLWRSILQWLGGMGIIAMAILLLPFLRVGGMQLFRAESSDRSDKVVSRPWDLAAYIGLLYLGLTAACAAVYRLAGMSGFDAVNHAMTTLSTGGYSTHDASFGYFANPAVQWAGIVFMLSGGLPFVAYIRTLRGKQPVLWRDSQVQAMLGILAAASAVLVVPVMDCRRPAVARVASSRLVQRDLDCHDDRLCQHRTTSVGAALASGSFSCWRSSAAAPGRPPVASRSSASRCCGSSVRRSCASCCSRTAWRRPPTAAASCPMTSPRRSWPSCLSLSAAPPF